MYETILVTLDGTPSDRAIIEHVKDLARVVAWTRTNIAKHGGDPDRYIAIIDALLAAGYKFTNLPGTGGFRANLGEGAQVHLNYWFE